MTATTHLGDDVRAALGAAADSSLAGPMAAYMKVAENGGLHFGGIRRPEVRRIARGLAEPVDAGTTLGAVHDLWANASVREERYTAQDLLALRWSAGRLDLLDLHRRMAVTGAWWDHVDEIAHRIGDLVVTHHDELVGTLATWSVKDDLWLRRLAIIGQLGLRDRIDLDLLGSVIEPNTGDGEFFVRKAIGWALRDAARTYPDWVRNFVSAHQLSPLSRREALKHLG